VSAERADLNRHGLKVNARTTWNRKKRA